jgi:hypothetical protein
VKSHETIKDLMLKSLISFNNQLETEKDIIRFSMDSNKYKVRQAKKSGKPNLDMPGKYNILTS